MEGGLEAPRYCEGWMRMSLHTQVPDVSIYGFGTRRVLLTIKHPLMM